MQAAAADSHSDSSHDTAIQGAPRRSIASARSAKEKTAAARRALAQTLASKKKLKADDEVEWGGHETSAPDFVPESVTDSIF